MRLALCVLACGLTLAAAVPPEANGTLFLMKDAVVTDNAVCLDGTPGAYYFAPGAGDGASKWFVFHEGGGWCNSLSDCYFRSKSPLGSSSTYPPTLTLSNYGLYLSNDSAVNPQMYNWNRVVLRYCDGASFSGSNSSVTVYNNTQIYFRGKHVLDAIIADLLANRGLAKATDLIVSGCSAGGLATYLHADKWASSVPAGIKVAAMPDSGFFVDYDAPSSVRTKSRWETCTGEAGCGEGREVPAMTDLGSPAYHTDMVWVFQAQNVTSGVNQACIAGYPVDQQWHCIFAEHTAPFIQTPIFPLQSEYDHWQILEELGSNATDIVNQLGANITARLENNLLNKPQNGVFLDSCVHHCGGWGSFNVGGLHQPQAFQAWYETPGSKRVFMQGQAYPCPDCCNPNYIPPVAA